MINLTRGSCFNSDDGDDDKNDDDEGEVLVAKRDWL